jgi:hypothetical protein
MAALHTGIELKLPGMTIDGADISAFPLYNKDVRTHGFPDCRSSQRRGRTRLHP